MNLSYVVCPFFQRKQENQVAVLILYSDSILSVMTYERNTLLYTPACVGVFMRSAMMYVFVMLAALSYLEARYNTLCAI